MNVKKAFIDTNIFIYTQRADNSLKKEIAEKVISQFDCVASTQVLNEITNVFTKKYPMPIEKVEHLLESIGEIAEIVIIDKALIIHALHLHHQYKLSYYDCLIVSAAIYSGCHYLFSEDMQDGLVIKKSLKIVNIFNHPEINL